jgi:hypothetical protein
VFTEGEKTATPWNVRAFGSRSNSSAVTLWAIMVLPVSISGAVSTTCTVCSSVPTAICASTRLVRPTITITSADSYREKPLFSKRTE